MFRSGHILRAVAGASFTVAAGRTLAVVGESGCGKSTLGRCVVRLLEPTSGEIWFRGHDLAALSRTGMLPLRRHVQMVFQDPYASLHPRMRIGEIIAEPLRLLDLSKPAAADRVRELLSLVRLEGDYAGRYPHELSGGMRQRVMIAIAMANDPELLIADEPTTALDVTVQAQIIELLQRLQKERRMGLVLISHDLGVVAGIADEVAIMYAGRICERGTVDAVFDRPHHPYTHGLLASLPKIDRTDGNLTVIPGTLPSLASLPQGCRFHPRCGYAQAICKTVEPALRPVGSGAVAACHFAETALYPDAARNGTDAGR
jgi:oligopeptide/dipeptide ABC transporter ATP-binding protein